MMAGAVARADPPGRVARLAYVNGAVSFAPSGSNDWVQAGVNRPLMPGDRLWVDTGGRDEVQIGSAALRMDGGSLVSVLNLDDRTAQFQLTQGRAYVRVRRLDPGEVVEVDTPNLAFSIRQPGVYRLEVDPSGASTAVAVRSGQAEAYGDGDGNAYLLDAGQGYRFGGTNLQDYQYAQLPADDDFERWAATRDRRRDAAVAGRYVSPELVGYEDLDDNGSWRNVPNYGSVWMPSHVASDWAPYRDGHWSWVDPWGWTWVDDAPWGYTVSHYGRWTHLDAGWGWVPGPPEARPVYAPALVAFVAGAALVLEANRGPGVAWFALGPRDVYRPSYRASPSYVTNVNVSNTVINRTEINRVVNITNVSNVNYANRQVPGAVTAVPTQAFVHAQSVRQAALPLNRQMLANASVVNKLALAPQPESRAGGQQARNAPAAAVMARQVIAHTPPPKLAGMPLAAATPAQVPRGAAGRGAARSEMAAMAAAAPQVKVVQSPRAGKALAPPPPRALASGAAQPPLRPEVARPPQLAGAQPQPPRGEAARPPQVAGPQPQPPRGAVARPPQMAGAQPPRGEAAHPPQLAGPQPQPQRGEVARPPQMAGAQPPRGELAHPPQVAAAQPPRGEAARPPQVIAALQPRPQPQHIETAPHPQPAPVHAEPPAHPQPPQHAESLPHAPPARAEAPRQMAMAKPPEPEHRAPPEVHRPPPAPEAQHPPPAAHPPAAKPEEHHAPPEKDKRKEEHQQ